MVKKMGKVKAKVRLFLTGKKFLRNSLDYNQVQVLSAIKKRVINHIKQLSNGTVFAGN
jgi:hypothetical protein